MATMPKLFTVLAGIDAGPSYLHFCLNFIRDLTERWSDAIARLSSSAPGRLAMQVGMLAIPALWLAAVVRSIRVKTWKPLVVTLLASVLGVIGVPIATWIGQIVVFLWWLGGYVADFFRFIVPWVIRILLWAGAIVGALAAVEVGGYLIYALIAYVHRNHRWLAVAIVIVLAAGLVGAFVLGWFDVIIAWLRDAVLFLGVWIARIAGWIGAFLAPIVAFVTRLFLVVMAFLLVVGIAVGTLGQAGRTVYLPFASAFKAGRDQGCCADLAAGSGVTMSLVLTAAVVDSDFGRSFAAIWSNTPVVSSLPQPIDGFGFLLPSAAKVILAPAFAGYVPFMDVALLVLVTAVGAASLLFGATTWTTERGSRIAMPIMLAVGAAIALALVVILFTLWLKAQDSSYPVRRCKASSTTSTEPTSKR